MLKPALVFTLHDPDGTFFTHLQAILPDLKAHFESAYICPSIVTQRNTANLEQLRADDFFTLVPLAVDLRVGDHFAHLYRHAARMAPPQQILHLCFIDRLTFALRSSYREQFLADIDALTPAQLPLIFQRSAAAWATHPQNYRELEGFVTQIGQTIFGKTLDYAWCYLAIRAQTLAVAMEKISDPGMSMVAELVLQIQHEAGTRAVDWLAWEDPYILARDARELKAERESSLAETNKRLSYVLPMVENLVRFAKNGKQP